MGKLSLFCMDLVLNSFTIIALAFFYGKVFIVKGKSSKPIYLVSLFISFLLSIYEVWDSTYYFVPYILIVSFPLLFFYKTNFQKKIFIFLCLGANFLNTLFIYDIITSFILKPKNHLLVYVTIFILTILTLLIAVKSSSNNQDTLPKSLWLLLILIPISSITAGSSAFYVLFSGKESIPVLIVLFAFFIPNIILFAVYDQILHYQLSLYEHELLKKQIALQQEHYQSLATSHETIKTLQHDFKNSVTTALSMATDDDNSILKQYLESMVGVISLSEMTITTGNPEIDSILNYKLAQMEKEEIKVSIQIRIPQNLNVGFKVAAVVLGNLLDNSIEACSKMEKSDKWVDIAINYINNALLIIIKNPYNGILKFSNGIPISTKENLSVHGIGLKSVTSILEDSGTLVIDYEDKIFTAKVALYDLCQV